jgi:hypothetical protein
MPKTEFMKVGQHHDVNVCVKLARVYLADVVNRARDYIYKSGYFVNAAGMERMLKPFSLVPTVV